MAEARPSNSMPDYPQVKLSEAVDYLNASYPVWLLTPHGIVVGANRLTNWLWQVRQIKELLGSNAFAIFSDNLRRIPKHANREFFTKKLALVKRMSHLHGPHHYDPFILAMKRDPDLNDIYDWEPDSEWADYEWQYKLHIGHPDNDAPADKLLTFHVTVQRHEEDGGFLICYKPHNEYTDNVVRQQYKRLSAHRDIEYVQYHESELGRKAKGIARPSEIDAFVPPFNQEFQKKFREAMLGIIQSPDCNAVLEDFRTAYEYRRKFPWLGENTTDGLAYALQAALDSYIISGPITAEEFAVPRGFGEETDSSIDSEWAERLRIAADTTIKEAFSLESFENELAEADIDIDTISSHTLQGYIADALERYYNRRMIGLSPDPI